jgi:hypothetical protein
MIIDERHGRWVRFEQTFKAKIMAIDGTWFRECLLVEASDSGALLETNISGLASEEFFLLLSSMGTPAFRRCKRVWVQGDRVAVRFDKRRLPGKPLQSSRNWEEMPA